MSHDFEFSDEDGQLWSFDNLSTQRYLEGHAPGVEAAAVYLQKKAVDLFMKGKDEEARMLRELAKEIVKEVVPELRRHAEQHEKEFPPKVRPKK